MLRKPPSTNLNKHFWIKFPLYPCLIFFWTTLNIVISQFSRAGQQNSGKGAAPIRELHPPTIPPAQY